MGGSITATTQLKTRQAPSSSRLRQKGGSPTAVHSAASAASARVKTTLSPAERRFAPRMVR